MSPRNACVSGGLPKPPELSVVVPVFEERQNLVQLHREVRDALGWIPWELVAVDDGSRDGSLEVLRQLAAEDGRVRVLSFGENRGQTAAMLAGFRAARGALVATLDADLQNDPRDLRALHDALSWHAAVAGVRARRHDGFVRRVSSRIANAVRNRVTGDAVTDTGCSLKLYRREALAELPPMRGMHRFLPTLLRMAGHSVIELPVHHRPRLRGASKYGLWNRLLPASMDLLAVRWMQSRRIDLAAVELTPVRALPPVEGAGRPTERRTCPVVT